MRPYLVLGLIVFTVAVMSGALSAEPKSKFTVTVCDALVKVLPKGIVPGQGTAHVRMIRNEYESMQLVVTATENLDSLTVEISTLVGPSKTTPIVEWHFVGYVPVRKGTPNTPAEHLVAKPPAELPDPLLDTKSVTLEAGRNQPIWLTVYAPKSTKPGLYKGMVTVKGGGQKKRVPLTVEVLPVILPDSRNLFITNWFSTHNITTDASIQLWSEPFWQAVERYARFMAEYRQNVVLTPIFALIQAREDGTEKLTFDFSRFDRWVEIFRRAGVNGLIEGGHLGSRSEWEAEDFDANRMTVLGPDGKPGLSPAGKVTSEEYRRFLSQLMPALEKHLEEKGWLDSYVQHLADEPIPNNAESYRKLASYVREFAPKIKIIDASMCTEIVGAIDIWVPLPTEYEQKTAFFEERRQAGDSVWFYTCLAPTGKYMNRFIDYPLIKTRLLHWMNFKYNLPGYLHWGFNHWRGDPFTNIEPDHSGPAYLPPGDSHIVYPGEKGLLSSIRLEAMRDGIEDYEMLKLLEKKDRARARAVCDSVIRSMTDYTLDAAEFRRAHSELVSALAER